MNALLVAILIGAAAATITCRSDAPTIVAGTAITGSTSGTGRTGITTCANTNSGSDWYRWNPAAGFYSIGTVEASTNYDTIVGVFEACVGVGVVGCDDDSGPGLNSLITGYFRNTTYYIQVGAYSSNTGGNYGLLITSLLATDPLAVPWANCAAAGAVPNPFVSTLVAGTTTGTPGCSAVSGSSMWYAWTAPNNSVYTLTPSCSATFSTVAGVWQGCNDGSRVSSSSNCASSTGGTCTAVTFNGYAGVTYFVQIGAYDATGAGAVTVTVTPTTPIIATAAAQFTYPPPPAPTPTPAPTAVPCTDDTDCPATEFCDSTGHCDNSSMMFVALAALLIQ